MNNLIILATVNAKNKLYGITANDFSAIAPNIQQGLLAQYIKSLGFPVEIIESDVFDISIQDLLLMLEKKKPLLLGIIATGANPSSSTMSMAGIGSFFEQFNTQKNGTTTFLWGPHPTVLPERTLQETKVDFIVRNEGWDTIPELFEALKSNRSPHAIKGLSFLNTNGFYCETPSSELKKDLNSLAPIDWDLMSPKNYRAHNWHCFKNLSRRTPYAIIWTSFGCPFQCTFCSINNLFGRRIQRFRSINNVIQEISTLVERHGVRDIKIMDELFVVSEKRIDDFCDQLGPRKYDLNLWAYARLDTVSPRILKRLKKIGMNWISYGFESSSDRILQQSRKGLRSRDTDSVIRNTFDAGISICADVMFGLPGETFQTMQDTYDFLIKYNFEYVNMYPLFPYPGTEFFAKAGPKKWEEYALYGYDCIPLSGENLSSADILRYRDESFLRYHSRPEYLTMIERKFNPEARIHIEKMTSMPLRRKILEKPVES